MLLACDLSEGVMSVPKRHYESSLKSSALLRDVAAALMHLSFRALGSGGDRDLFGPGNGQSLIVVVINSSFGAASHR